MAEAPDSTRSEPAHPAGIVPTPAGTLPSEAFPESAPAADSAIDSYRPLSLLAGASLVLAAGYALVVVLGFVVALFMRTPWLLPLWTFGIPMAGLMLAWMAQARIRSTEGALSGLPLTRWSVALCVCVGLSYGAYYAATGIAVRQQADRFARQWINELAKGRIEIAYWMTMRPPRPPVNANLPGILELRNLNNPDLGRLDTLSGFAHQDYVRLLQQAGSQASVELFALEHWEYKQGGYLVNLNYRITTPLATFHLQTYVQGVESKASPREFQGRQWHTLLGGTTLTDVPTPSELTSEGKAMTPLWQDGKDTALNWLNSLRRGNPTAGYPLTVPPAERERVALTLSREPLGNESKGLSPEERNRRQAFVRGDLVKADKESFWAADEDMRKQAVTAIRGLFAPGNIPPNAEMNPVKTRVPLISRDGERVILRYDVQMNVRSSDPKDAGVAVELRVVISTDHMPDPELHQPVTWRIEGVELIRARTAPRNPPGPGGPGGQGGPG